MKAILEFLLPEEREDFELHSNAGALHAAIWDYAQWLRGICKHGNPDDYNAEDCRTKLYEFINERELNLL
jgi:hypothetical protein